MVPPSAEGSRALRLLEPLRKLINPKVYAASTSVPQRRALLVGNHTVMGMLDSPLMCAELWEHEFSIVRSLGDHAHFKVPVWRDVLTRPAGWWTGRDHRGTDATR